jgi:hypothetical protein
MVGSNRCAEGKDAQAVSIFPVLDVYVLDVYWIITCGFHHLPS